MCLPPVPLLAHLRCANVNTNICLTCGESKTLEGSSAKISLDVCPKNNADFDGDEIYGVVPATDASRKELNDALSLMEAGLQ